MPDSPVERIYLLRGIVPDKPVSIPLSRCLWWIILCPSPLARCEASICYAALLPRSWMSVANLWNITLKVGLNEGNPVNRSLIKRAPYWNRYRRHTGKPKNSALGISEEKSLWSWVIQNANLLLLKFNKVICMLKSCTCHICYSILVSTLCSQTNHQTISSPPFCGNTIF